MAKAPLRLLSPKNDFVFKALFGDAKHLEPIASFLQATLGLPEEEFADLAVIDPNLNPERAGDKHCVLDVRIKTRSGREVDVEIQVKYSPEIHNRLQYYTARMVAGQKKAGEDYRELPQSVTIVIADFVLWRQSARYHHRFSLHDAEAGVAYPNSMEIHTLELPKISAKSDGSKLWDWLKFFSLETKDDLESFAGKDTAMAKVVGRLMELSEDERARLQAEAHDKWLWDEAGRLRESKEEGEAIGLAKGVARGEVRAKKNIARKMLLRHTPVEDVAEMTGLSEAEVKRLATPRKSTPKTTRGKRG